MKTKLLVLFSVFNMIFYSFSFSSSLWDSTPNGYYISDERVLIVPEAERHLSFIIIGL